jgi:peptidoglycan/LPS O-acetylase OafA/YrhL
MPALLTVLAACMIFGWVVLLANEYEQLGKHVFSGIAFIANFAFWSEASYFDQASELKPLLHLWSLGIEEQFYIFWPLLIGLAWRHKGSTIILIGVLAGTSFLLNHATVDAYPTAAFYSPLSRCWELMTGSILAYFSVEKRLDQIRGSALLQIVGLLMILSSVWLISTLSRFPGFWALLPTGGTALIILGRPDTFIARYLLGNKLLVGLGLISYPLYLWHWPALSFATIINGSIPHRNVRIIAVAVSFVAAWLTYEFIEKKVRHREGPMVIKGLVGVSVVLLMGGLLTWTGFLSPRNNAQGVEKVIQAVEDWSFPIGLDEHTYRGLTFYRKRADPSAPTVMLLGDSLVEQYSPRVNALINQDPGNYNSVVFATVGGCPPIPNVYEHRKPLCGELLESAQAYMEEYKVETLVIGACWDCYFLYQSGPQQISQGPIRKDYVYRDESGTYSFADDYPESQELALQSLESFIQKVSAGREVYLLLNNPTAELFDPKNMLTGSRFTKLEYAVDYPDYVQITPEQEELRSRLKNIAATSGAAIIDPIAFLCKGDKCPVFDEQGTPLYKDRMHMRPFFVETRVQYLDPVLLRKMKIEE